MSFSQGWDTGFRVILIYVGIVFVWLGMIEPYFASRSVSVIVMNMVAVAISAAFVSARVTASSPSAARPRRKLPP
ncbi:hypothetical protein [Sinorhizobium medicae]|uniref:hypothetical protein n=1 Tax=Sinorhizobium medicae TaxID=110321 RepID=UPI001F332AE9|nr:hypothetical protein [Sinorhizobium medicae]